MTPSTLDLHLLLTAADLLAAATAALALLADLAHDPALRSDVLVLLDAIECETGALEPIIARVARG